MKIWRTPRDFSRTPGGTRNPDWEPLVYIIAWLSLSSSWAILKTKFVLKGLN